MYIHISKIYDHEILQQPVVPVDYEDQPVDEMDVFFF